MDILYVVARLHVVDRWHVVAMLHVVDRLHVVAQVLDEMKVHKEMNREVLVNVARTSLRTKVYSELADMLAEVSTYPVVSNVLVMQLLMQGSKCHLFASP